MVSLTTPTSSLFSASRFVSSRSFAEQKVKAAQDAWNTRDPEKVALAYTEDSKWRNCDEFFEGREAIRDFLAQVGSRARLPAREEPLVLH